MDSRRSTADEIIQLVSNERKLLARRQDTLYSAEMNWAEVAEVHRKKIDAQKNLNHLHDINVDINEQKNNFSRLAQNCNQQANECTNEVERLIFNINENAFNQECLADRINFAEDERERRKARKKLHHLQAKNHKLQEKYQNAVYQEGVAAATANSMRYVVQRIQDEGNISAHRIGSLSRQTEQLSAVKRHIQENISRSLTAVRDIDDRLSGINYELERLSAKDAYLRTLESQKNRALDKICEYVIDVKKYLDELVALVRYRLADHFNFRHDGEWARERDNAGSGSSRRAHRSSHHTGASSHASRGERPEGHGRHTRPEPSFRSSGQRYTYDNQGTYQGNARYDEMPESDAQSDRPGYGAPRSEGAAETEEPAYQFPPGDNLGYYQTLGVARSASEDEIKRAYRKLAIQRHPDKAADKSQSGRAAATQEFQKLAEAYEILKDREKRETYDRSQ